ncbi:MAG: D-aminoacylase [Dehalobacterium sp.]
MKLLKRREFLLGLSSLGLLSLLRWDYVYGYVTSITVPEEKPQELPPPEPAIVKVDCDYVLENGLIVDGTGKQGFTGHVGIKGNEIAAVGDFVPSERARRINARGLVVAPGFIDLHTHTENYWLAGGNGEMVLKQGVTTQIGGNCGNSVPSIKEYFQSLQQAAINVGLFVGYKNLRGEVVPAEVDLIGTAELNKMKERLAQGMEEGAFGLSVGLSYYPQFKATKEELIELCKVVKEAGGFYSTHIRNENDNVLTAVEEAIDIGLAASIPVQYSHVKAEGEKNWGKMPQALALMGQAVEKGLDITGDVYPYTYSSLDVAKNNKAESMSEGDMLLALSHPLLMIGSDSGLSREGQATHPRAYANFSRILSRYTGEGKALSLETAVHKITYMPAKRLGLIDRGIIAMGKKADLAVFNLSGVQELATRDSPNQFSTGMKYVFVNGKLSLEQGKLTGVKAGGPLRHKQSS